MRTPLLLRLAAAVVLAGASLVVAAPAQAATPEPAVPADQGTQPKVTYTATTSPEAQKAGLKLIVNEDGRWQVQQAQKPGGAGTLAYPISYCTGNFTGPRMISTWTLDFGGEQTCDNYRDWPHRIIVTLESTCSDWWCVVFQEEGSIDSGWRSQRVASAYGGLGCDNLDRRKYRNTVDVYARGVYIGGAVGTYEPVLSCSM
ncbi:hypothetical protein ACFY2R_26065 [Micromonospora olivasterospora]|uniref:Secreted protein n=1 Tax=Micromonospora olivasterospora TaxID=1880 RepID=A0A562IFS6_MICOL|nr:hypothetical protein [Micromonospora olivasterospora]TWH69593.1 hypothetical protein JD77_04603 [Micromonospora olivasterospora]